MEQNEKINEIIKTTIENVNSLIDVNTVVGNPFTVDESTFIPLSKVTMGLLCGGGDYGEIKFIKRDNTFAGGNGSVISVKPLGFLVITGDNCKIIEVNESQAEKLFDKAAEIINNIMEKNN